MHNKNCKERAIWMKNKKEPFLQAGAYLSYVTVCKNGSDDVVPQIARS